VTQFLLLCHFLCRGKPLCLREIYFLHSSLCYFFLPKWTCIGCLSSSVLHWALCDFDPISSAPSSVSYNCLTVECISLPQSPCLNEVLSVAHCPDGGNGTDLLVRTLSKLKASNLRCTALCQSQSPKDRVLFLAGTLRAFLKKQSPLRIQRESMSSPSHLPYPNQRRESVIYFSPVRHVTLLIPARTATAAIVHSETASTCFSVMPVNPNPNPNPHPKPNSFFFQATRLEPV